MKRSKSKKRTSVEEQVLLQQMMQMHAQGMSYDEIGDELAKDGIYYSGKSKWRSPRIAELRLKYNPPRVKRRINQTFTKAIDVDALLEKVNSFVVEVTKLGVG